MQRANATRQASGLTVALVLTFGASPAALAQDAHIEEADEAPSGPAAGMVGDYGYGSPPGSSIPEEVDGDIVGLGLTPVLYWGPVGTIDFKTAVTCHFGSMDRYIVLGVFEVTNGNDELWAVWVDGLSTSGTYGEVLATPGPIRIASQDAITHLDCTPDGGSYVYIIWDNLPHPGGPVAAKWRRVSSSGAVSSTRTLPRAIDPDHGPYGPGIAYHGGRVLITAADDYCFYYWWAYDVTTWPPVLIGGPLNAEGGGIDPRVTDVEWNADGHFVIAVLSSVDGEVGAPPHIFTRRVTTDGEPYPTGSDYWDISFGAISSDYRDIDLIFTDNSGNYYDRFIAQFDSRVVWLGQDGQRIGTARAVGPWQTFAACEYWGPLARIGHTFSPYSLRTRHNHWYYVSLSPLETYTVDSEYRYPTACGSSETYSDPELLLIREYWGSPPASAYMYFNIEAED